MTYDSSWTEAERQRCAEMLRDKKSAGQIGPAFGLSRNAIIGRVHRDKMLSKIGFQGGRASWLNAKQSRIAGVLAAPKPAPKPPVVKPAKQNLRPNNIVGKKEARAFDPGLPVERPAPRVKIECRAVSLMELKRGECRWPCNASTAPNGHLFCGLPAESDRSYCSHHSRLSVGRGTDSERSADRGLARVA